MLRYLVLITFPLTLMAAPNFTAQKAIDHGVEVIRLMDAAQDVEVAVAPSLGNRAYELKVHGKNLLFMNGDLGTRNADGALPFNAIPFLAPWGNRIPGGGFWANGKRYNFNSGMKNLSIDPNTGIAIHGMLAASPLWEISEFKGGKDSAHVTCKLPFWRYPDLMANWPFAHEYEMTYTLSRNGLEVNIAVKNLSTQPMPMVIGFHPYFQIPDVPRSEWSAHIPARMHVEMDAQLLPTGQMTASKLTDQVSLSDHTFDDGFTDLVRDASGNAIFAIQAGVKRIEVVFGPKYPVALVFVPPKQNFACFEPMAGITNAVNLAHDGKYQDLQTVAPNATWRESFWIRFSGF